MSKVAVITGTGKGLGLELTKKAVSEGYDIIAITYPMTEELKAFAQQNSSKVFPYEIDVRDAEGIEACRKEVADKYDSVELIINNAGVWMDFERKELDDPDFDIDMCYTEFDINAMGTLRISKAFLPMLKKSEFENCAIVSLSSDCASYSPVNKRKSEYAYCMSKACVNIISNLLNNALKETKVKVLAVFPGWMQTDMGYAGPGNPKPRVPVNEAAECIFKLIYGPKKESVFCNRFGEEMV